MAHKFDISKTGGGLQILVAWPKERKFTEWRLIPKEDSENCACNYFVSTEGIFVQGSMDGSSTDGTPSKGAGWRKVKKIDEIRGSSGKMMEIVCTAVE